MNIAMAWARLSSTYAPNFGVDGRKLSGQLTAPVGAGTLTPVAGFIIAADPFQIEIINHADWWQPYVPPFIALFGTLLVAAAAFYGVRKNNETTRDSIAAADRREVEKWRRETVLKLSAEVQLLAFQIEEACEAAAKPVPKGELFDFDPIFTEVKKFRLLLYQLTMVGYLDGGYGTKVWKATSDLLDQTVALRTYSQWGMKRDSSSGLPLPDSVRQLHELSSNYQAALDKLTSAISAFAYRATLHLDPNVHSRSQIDEAMKLTADAPPPAHGQSPDNPSPS